jgi:hypothetical protein
MQVYTSNFLQGFGGKGSASNSVQGPDDKSTTYTSENYRKTSYEVIYLCYC